ncbi:MAG: hypothetical protein HY308_17555 [Gammaproteobacteria bacterium]|nr:hypothetical protein [Gammaproteobacteria bacterium]
MKADLTRDTFDPLKHFTRVLMQQGRVQVDADWNEQASILLRYLRTLATDLIGDAGGPVNHCGFGLSVASGIANDFRIGPGRYYVNGLLCELETTALPVTQPADFAPNEINVPTLVLDGISFRKPQTGQPQPYVELLSNTTSPLVVQITDVDLEQRKLTLSKDVSAVLKGPASRLRRVVTYRTQPDYLIAAEQPFALNKNYMVYLDVWERLVTYIEDDSIREVALGGPDTATRTQLVWQVKIAEGSAGATYGSPCDNFLPKDTHFFSTLSLANRGQLKAKAKQDAQSTDPCITPPHSQYRGVENQLYRVEIHSGGSAWDGDGEAPASGAATFKWSRENGSVIYAIRRVATDSSAKTTTVTLESLGRDDRFGLVESDWVELVNDDLVLLDGAKPLLQVQAIDRAAMTVTLSGMADANFAQDVAKRPLLRRWDQRQGDPTEGGLQLANDGAAFILESGDDQWLELEDGVKVQFQLRTGNNPYVYQTGDYWLIPARVATGDVEWPTVIDSVSGVVMPIALPPKGIEHHYAPLGVINVNNYGTLSILSCRKQFSPMATRPPYDYAFVSAGIGTANLTLRDEIAAPAGRTKKSTPR